MSNSPRADVPAALQRIGHVRYKLRAAASDATLHGIACGDGSERAVMFRDAAITAMGCASTLIALALAIQTAMGA